MSLIPEKLTIDWLKENYKAGTVSPAQVIEEIIQRAEADKEMNIWITPPEMEWIKPYIDRLDTLDYEEAPLWGVPFAVKDNIDVAGVPTTAGCDPYAYTPDEHASVVGRLVAAGAIPVGKANLDQFATGLVGTRSPHGETHNALREELISGGSSSGSAVAVARGHAAFSLGTDTAGSGRVPAALNNLVGYKPSLGAWPVKGVVPACESLDCVTVFAHNLTEAVAVDAYARGEESLDPWSKKLPALGSKQPEKICLPEEAPSFYGPFAAEYEAAWEKSVEKLKELNIPVEYIDTKLFSDAAEILYGGPWIAERWTALGDFVTENPGATFPVTEEVLRSGSPEKHDAASLFQAIHKLQGLKLETKKLLKNAVLAMPTCGGTWTREEVRQDPIRTNSDMGRYTNHCNLLDLCAVAIPSEEAAENLPFGITLFSLADQEDIVCGTAASFAGQSEREDIEPSILSGKEKDAMTYVAVCGLHMRGFPLEKQMAEHNAEFVKETVSAPKYKMVKLSGDPEKPGMIKQHEGGSAIRLELWKMPVSSLGSFTTLIPAPLGIGKVELEDGTEVPGFICEGYAADKAEDITFAGGWKQAVLK